MKGVPRGLSVAEEAAWARLAQSVTPLAGRNAPRPVKVVKEPQPPQSPQGSPGAGHAQSAR